MTEADGYSELERSLTTILEYLWGKANKKLFAATPSH